MAEKRASFFTGVFLVVLGFVLATWVSWPLARFLTSAIPYTFSAKPTERVAGIVPGDQLQYLYHLNLLREALDGEIRPFSNPYEFAGPYQRRSPTLYFPAAFLYAPFSYVSRALGYNALVFLSFVGTMIAGYGLARAWGANRASAFCAGIVLTLFPHRLSSLYGGHAVGSSFFLFPMAWWGLEKNWQTGRRGWGIMAGLSLFAMSLQDAHHLFFFCLLLPLWVIWKLVEEKALDLPEATRDEGIRPASAVRWQGMVAAVLMAGAYHFHEVRMRAVSPVSLTFLGLVVFFSVAVIGVAWLMELALKWLGVKDRNFRRRWLSWPWLSFCVLLGYLAADYVNKPKFGSRLVLASLVLFAVCHFAFLIRAIQKRRFSAGRIRLPFGRVVKLWPSAAGLILAVIYPLYLRVMVFAKTGVEGGRSLYEVGLYSVPFREFFLRSPERGTYVGWAFSVLLLISIVVLVAGRRIPTRAGERSRLGICLVLAVLGMILACGVLLGSAFPLYNVLYRFVPFLSYIRSMAKYLVLTATGGGVAVALVLTVLERSERSRILARLAPLFAGALMILDWGLLSSTGVSVLPERSAIYDRVMAEGKGTRLLEVPIWPGDSAFSSPYQYGTILTGVPTINGYSPTVPVSYRQNVADPLYPLNFGILGEKEFELLRTLNVRLVNFHQELFPRQVSALPATHSLKRLLLNPNLRLVTQEDGASLFRIADETYQNVSEAPWQENSSVFFYVPHDVLLHQVGEQKEDDEAIAGKAWCSDGKQGFLFFGPFLMLPPGDYVASFRVRVEAPRELPEVGYLDVYSGEGTELATRRPLKPSDWPETYGYQFVEIPFRVGQPQPVQTRGFFSGEEKATVALDFVVVRRAGLGENIRLEAEDFFSKVGRVAKDEKATQGICLEVTSPPPDGEPVLEEAFVYLAAGRYQVQCVARGAGETIATLRLRRVGMRSSWRDFDIRGGKSEEAFATNSGALNLATGGVYGISLWPARGSLKAVDYISFILGPLI